MEDSVTRILYFLKIQGQQPDQDRIQVRDDLFGLVAQGPLPVTAGFVRQIARRKGTVKAWKTRIAAMPYGEIVRVESGEKNQKPHQ